MDKGIPKNMQYVQSRGDFSICEISRRPIKEFENGYFPTGVLAIQEQVRNETAQIPEKTFENMFFKCIGEAIKNNNFQYHFFRMDKASLVPENGNNKPYNLREDSTDELKHFEVFGQKWTTDCSGNRY